MKKLKVDQVGKKLAQYKRKCLNQVSRKEDIAYKEQFLDCRPEV